MNSAPDTIFLLYEPEQVDALEVLFKNSSTTVTILALDAEIEQLLAGRHIPYISGRVFRDSISVERVVFADEYAQILKSDAWKFLTYRGISLAALFVFPLQDYLNRSLYYVELFRRVADSDEYTKWIVFDPVGGPPVSGGPLSSHMYDVVLRSASLIAKSRGIMLQRIPSTKSVEARAHWLRFMLMRAMFGIVVTLLNVTVAVVRRPRNMRLLVTDYWRNMSTWTEALPESEILLLDRSELARIPLKSIWKHRMRFLHLSQFLNREDSRRSSTHDEFCKKEWVELRAQTGQVLFRGTDLSPLLLEALDTLVTSAATSVRTQIDGAYALISKIRPAAVVLRASTGGQTHLGALAMVAKKLGVPTVELQHGLEYLGPGSMSRNHAAEYLAIYGSNIRTELECIGYEPGRLVEVGSPRFDVYRPSNSENKNSVLCIAPDLYIGAGFDSYDCIDYFSAFFKALPVGRQAIVKLRGGQSFFISTIERLRGTHECIIEEGRPLQEVLGEVREMVSCYSTAILEGMQCGVPVIISPVAPMETAVTRFHFDAYLPSGAVRIAGTAEELLVALSELEDVGVYQTQRQAAFDFLDKSFLFDGHSSKRFAATLHSLAKE